MLEENCDAAWGASDKRMQPPAQQLMQQHAEKHMAVARESEVWHQKKAEFHRQREAPVLNASDCKVC